MLLRYSSIGGELQLGRGSSKVTSIYGCLGIRLGSLWLIQEPDLILRRAFGAGHCLLLLIFHAGKNVRQDKWAEVW